jgi:hypothetical protein
VTRALHVDDIRSGRVKLDARGRLKSTRLKVPAHVAREREYFTWPRCAVLHQFTVPGLRTCSELNQREHWTARNQRKHAQQLAVYMALANLTHVRVGLPSRVTLTRVAEKAVDPHAEWWKHIVDEIARWLCVDDADPRVAWEFAQEATRKRNTYAIRVVAVSRP